MISGRCDCWFLECWCTVIITCDILYIFDEGGIPKMPTFGQLSEFMAESECMSSYLERVELYFLANSVQNDKKVAILLSSIGAKTYEVLRSRVSPDQQSTRMLDVLKTLLKAHFEPKPLVISERFHFYLHNQLAGESVTDFLVELRRLATL